MRRKILLAVGMAMLFAFALVMAVGAVGASNNEYGEITTIDGIAEPTIIDKTARVVVVAKDGTYYTLPAYYILEDNATFRWKQNAEASAILGYSQSNANNDFRPYVVRIEIPEGITSINPGTEGGAYAFEDAKKLIEATIPSTMTVIGNYVFNRANSLVTLNGFDGFMERATKIGARMLAETSWGAGIDLVIPSQLTTIPEYCFYGTKIKSVTFPDTLITIGQRAFQGCTSLTSVELPSSLERMKNHVFASCTSLASIDMSKCTGLKEIGEYCFEKSKITSFDFTPFASSLETISFGLFNECKSMTTVIGYELVDCATAVGENMFKQCPLSEIKFPKNIISIGDYAFYQHASTQTELRIPNGVTKIGNHAFTRKSQGGGSGLRIYLPASLTTVSNNYTFENWHYSEMYIPATLTTIITGFCNYTAQKGVVYYYTGELNGFTISSTNNSAMLNAEWISADAFVGASSECNYIVYGYNTCEAFYEGTHIEDNNPCVINCTRCKLSGVAEANPVHKEVYAISYTDFSRAGTKVITCGNAGCKYKATEEVEALFTTDGYSIPEDGRGGIAISFNVNKEAIGEYEKVIGKTLRYGVFAVASDRIGTNDIINTDGAIIADVNASYVGFEMKITGIETDAHKSAKLSLGAYVIVDGVASYLQASAPNEGDSYHYITYNDIYNS